MAADPGQKAPCENHFRAIEMAMLLSKACDLTGVVAIACARHGCFAPNSVANLFHGEQQKNVDWAFLQALKTTHVDPRQGAMIIYDIACQYIVHLQDRIGHLLPEGLTIDSAIGLFHVHGHKDICFFRYATSFIPGAAVVAGEILESLWAVLNAVTPAMRTATLAHRAEIMDDHMTDSNHKKCLGMATALSERFGYAAEMAETAKEYYLGLCSGINAMDMEEWETNIKLAEDLRLEDRSVMDILGATQVNEEHGLDQAEEGPAVGAVAEWIQLAINIEESQYVLLLQVTLAVRLMLCHCRIDIQDRVRRLANDPREDDRKAVEKLRELLMSQFDVLEALRQHLTVGAFGDAHGEDDGDDPAAYDDFDRDIGGVPTGGAAPVTRARVAAEILGQASLVPPERRRLSIPSTWVAQDNPYRMVELDLRLKQATKTLQALRDAIADKSFQYSHVIRVAPRKGVRTRARAAIAKLNHDIIYLCRVYGRCRAAMVQVGADDGTLQKYQILLKEDVRSSTALLNPNTPGSTRLQLSWIWRRGSAGNDTSPEALRECEQSIPHFSCPL